MFVCGSMQCIYSNVLFNHQPITAHAVSTINVSERSKLHSLLTPARQPRQLPSSSSLLTPARQPRQLPSSSSLLTPARQPRQLPSSSSLLTPARQPRQFRSSNSDLLFVRADKSITPRASSVAAPTLEFAPC